MNFMGRTTFVKSDFFIAYFAPIKNFPFNFFDSLERNKMENIVDKGNSFLCVHASRNLSGTSERANGRVSSPVLTYGF